MRPHIWEIAVREVTLYLRQCFSYLTSMTDTVISCNFSSMDLDISFLIMVEKVIQTNIPGVFCPTVQ